MVKDRGLKVIFYTQLTNPNPVSSPVQPDLLGPPVID